MRKSIFTSLFLFVFLLEATQLIGQGGLPIGAWRVHLPYRNAKYVTGSASSVWCASDYGIFRFNKGDKSIERITKVTGLSDLNIGAINYEAQQDVLVIGYKNGNIDIIRGSTIVNIPDIKRASIIGGKAINNIYFNNNLAYLACGFGIVVLDLVKLEVKDTYLIGNNGTNREVFDIITDGTLIYAATEEGVSVAALNNPFLSNFASWSSVAAIPSGIYSTLGFYSGKILVNKKQTAFNTDAIYYIDPLTLAADTLAGWGSRHSTRDMEVYNNQLYIADIFGVFLLNPTFTTVKVYFTTGYSGLLPNDIHVDNQNLWVADGDYGLLEASNEFSATSILPNGPSSISVFTMTAYGNEILVAPGNRDDAWNNVYSREGISLFREGNWINFDRFSLRTLVDSAYDFLACAIDPDDANHFYIGSWGEGVLEIRNGALAATYDYTNSPLQSRPAYPWCGISGMAYDEDKNLWIVNSHVPQCLKVRLPSGQWISYDFTGLVAGETTVGPLLLTKTGQKWMILPRGGGAVVFDDKGTLNTFGDDSKRKLGFTAGTGDIPGSEVTCMVEDKDGEVWIGTDDGIGVFYTPDNIFNASGFDCQRVLVQQGNTAQELLAGQEVTAIAIDGANRKWIATRGGGVFLLSEDGTREIHHFTTDNSPLFSNNVVAISVNPSTGEVFFGTDKGIISYGGTANEGGDKNGDVYAFPNPVRPGYAGPIAVRGLVKDADVKITDVRGNVVFTTKALGGQVTWDGNTFSGQRAATGVYLVFITNDDGSETAITKILFIN
jgi:hypothetical protein